MEVLHYPPGMPVTADTHLTTEDAAKLIGVSARTLGNWRVNREKPREREGKRQRRFGPSFVRVGGRVFYLPAEIERYLVDGEPGYPGQRETQEKTETEEKRYRFPLPKTVPSPPRR